MLVNCAQTLALPRAGFAFPLILRLGVGDRLPLEIGNRIRSAAGERLDVIFAVAWTGAAGFPGRWARMLPLEFPRHLTRSVLFCRNRGHGEHNRSRNDQGEQFRGSAHYSARVALIDRARWSRCPPGFQSALLDAVFLFGPQRTGKIPRPHGACQRSLDNARRRAPYLSSKSPKRLGP